MVLAASLASLLAPTGSEASGGGAQPLGAEFQVNSYTTHFQREPAIASDAVGNFIVVWNSRGSVGDDTLGTSIQAQRYASDGTLLGEQFQVNAHTVGEQLEPAVVMDVGDGFVVTWESIASSDNDPYGVQGQRFGSDGARRGTEFQVNTYTPNFQGRPAVAVDAKGDFVVVWESLGTAGSIVPAYSIQGQRYASDGSPRGE